jgi:protein TonB
MQRELIGAVIAVVGAAAAAPALLSGTAKPPAASQRAQPRDARPGEPRPPTKQEAELRMRIAGEPGDLRALLDLARLQAGRGAIADAESTLLRARQLAPSDIAVHRALAVVYARSGRFDRAVATLEHGASLQPADPEGYHVLGTFYFEKARDETLSSADRLAYIGRGLAAEDQALEWNPDYLEALVYKNLLLRIQSTLEPDPARQEALVKQADALRGRALQVRDRRTDAAGRAPGNAANRPPVPPPPPPPPPTPGITRTDAEPAYGRTSYTVAGAVSPPAVLKEVRPVYPPVALHAGIEGTVILEATLDGKGRVSDARIVQSAPLFDQSAIDAVKLWEFEPRSDVAAAPLMITVTVQYKAQP